jgi:hypothetical protein
VTTVGGGNAATRVINWFHWAALSVRVALSSGAGAVCSARARCAADAVAARLSAADAGEGTKHHTQRPATGADQ